MRELVEITIKEANELGFGDYGICRFIENMVYVSKSITHHEGMQLDSFLMRNKPDNLEINKGWFSEYWFPLNEKGHHERILFLEDLLKKLSQ